MTQGAKAGSPVNDRRLLNLPPAPRTEFERNFIKTAVCELRFPTLLEFESKPPVELQRRLRKDYPHYERERDVSVSPGAVEQEFKHLFRSKKRDWLVSFKSSSIALETTRYRRFEEFADRLAVLLDRSAELIDSDFFTRVGLRYIDEIPIPEDTIEGWVRPELISPLAAGTYGQVERFIQEVRGSTEVGRFTFRHSAGPPNGQQPTYNLDFDFHEENVQADDVLDLVASFNELSFRFFVWAIGEKARTALGEATPK